MAVVEFPVGLIGQMIVDLCEWALLKNRFVLRLVVAVVAIGLVGLFVYLLATRPLFSA